MPSTSPGREATTSQSPITFAQVLPGAPTASLQAFATFVFRFKRYVAYISGAQLNILSSPTKLVQAIAFEEELVAIAAQNETGKLVVAGKQRIWTLGPHTEGWTRVWWNRELQLCADIEAGQAHWLSWGDNGEVLIAGDRALTLFSSIPLSRAGTPAAGTFHNIDSLEERTALWSKNVSSPIRQAEFSPTASLIASCGRYDRLVKIWRRLSYEECLFDHTYLPHPAAVTNLHWRASNEDREDRRSSGISSRHDEDCEVLYTVASDGILRIWRTGGMHDMEILRLYTTVDLISAIPQSPSLTVKGQSRPQKSPRYVSILPSESFCAAVSAAVGITPEQKPSHSKELLKELATKEPDVVVAFDGQGRMSAWGIQSIGHKRRPETPTVAQAYHIAHAEGLQLRLPSETAAICATWLQDDKLHLLTHALAETGEIVWWQGDVETVFSAAASGLQSISKRATWTGHQSAIHELRSVGDGFTTRSGTELSHWKKNRNAGWRLKALFNVAHDVLATALIDTERLLLTAYSEQFALSNSRGTIVARCRHNLRATGKIWVNSCDSPPSGLFVSDSASEVVRWIVRGSHSGERSDLNLEVETVTLEDRNALRGITHLVAVPMIFEPQQAGLVSITKSGLVACSLIQKSTSGQSILRPFVEFELGVALSTIFAANAEFAATYSQESKEIVVVDLTDGYVEYRRKSDWPIQDLSCSPLGPRQNFLAVAYKESVEILAQGRYESREPDQVWHSVKIIDFSGLGLSTSATTWTRQAGLALSASNGVFVVETDPAFEELSTDLQAIVEEELLNTGRVPMSMLCDRLRAPIPIWHPKALSYMLRRGYLGQVTSIVEALVRQLKFWTAGDVLLPTLGMEVETLLIKTKSIVLEDAIIDDLLDQLAEKDLPGISRHEQRDLVRIVRALSFLREHAGGLDANALRYLIDWKLQLLTNEDVNEKKTYAETTMRETKSSIPAMQWREICFAYHSKTQQPLLDILILHYDNKLTWEIACRLGIMAWLLEREALERIFEQLGQSAYRADSPPDPVNASLYYLALHKKQTLLALWRIATWHREQRSTMNFLKRDFSRSDSQTAAKKNAYALMGKRRFQYAAAFFLLAEDPASAVSLLAGQCEDTQFAIAVARLFCGDGSQILQKLLEDRIVPQAEKLRDRWLLSWCYSVTSRKSVAAEMLICPLDGVRMWSQDDPATIILYEQLRSQPSEHEYDALLRATRILRRSGIWLGALALTREWRFKTEQLRATVPHQNGVTSDERRETTSVLDDYSASTSTSVASEPPSMLDGFTQAAATDGQPVSDQTSRETKAAELLAKIKAKKEAPAHIGQGVKKKPEPTQFKEPDAESLLNNFGF